MSKTRSDAERLLNTIVSSRVRLSALRGDTAASVEPSMADDGAPKVDTPPSISQPEDPEPADTAQADIFDELPPDDDLTDFNEPPVVLGIDVDDHQDDHIDIHIPATHREAPAASRDQADQPVGATASQAAPDVEAPDPTADDIDPFSFIDLIPPDPDAEVASESMATNTHHHTPPPIRTKPLMPLPTAAAAGAPSSQPTAPQRVDKEADWEEALSAKKLSTPRAVAPRLLDPDRAHLEVDVYVNEDDDDALHFAPSEPPQLTETLAPKQSAAPQPQPHAPRESVFDLVTEGIEALNRGDIRTALEQLSDALDWEPAHLEARLFRGRCRRDRGDIAGAMSDFLKAERTAPHSCEPHVEIGDLFFAKKEYGRAIMHYTEALSIHPGHSMALCRRGISHHHRRQSSQALQDLEGAKSLDPNIPNIERYIRMVTTGTRPPSRR